MFHNKCVFSRRIFPNFQIRDGVMIKILFCWIGWEPQLRWFSFIYLSVISVISELFITVLTSAVIQVSLRILGSYDIGCKA